MALQAPGIRGRNPRGFLRQRWPGGQSHPGDGIRRRKPQGQKVRWRFFRRRKIHRNRAYKRHPDRFGGRGLLVFPRPIRAPSTGRFLVGLPRDRHPVHERLPRQQRDEGVLRGSLLLLRVCFSRQTGDGVCRYTLLPQSPAHRAEKPTQKEDVMKCSLVGLLMLLASPAFAQEAVPQIPFDASDPLKLPKDLYLGEVTGVAVNSKGNIFVLSRGNTTGPAYAAAAAQLLEFDRNGNFVREIGKNLYAWSFGHTVRVDRSDNVWITDKGSDMVVKFNPRGRVLLVFGRKQEASDEETGPVKHPKPPLPAENGRFRQVTDVAFDPAGNAYISDGYINSRVAKVDRNGKWVKSWGDRGTKPGEFNTPHSIAADAKGNIYVADRGNRRIQVFDGRARSCARSRS